MSVDFKITEQVKKDFQATIDFWKVASESNDIKFNKKQWISYDNMYYSWKKAYSIEEKEAAAKQIYEFCLTWCNENIFNQEIEG